MSLFCCCGIIRQEECAGTGAQSIPREGCKHILLLVHVGIIVEWLAFEFPSPHFDYAGITKCVARFGSVPRKSTGHLEPAGFSIEVPRRSVDMSKVAWPRNLAENFCFLQWRLINNDQRLRWVIDFAYHVAQASFAQWRSKWSPAPTWYQCLSGRLARNWVSKEAAYLSVPHRRNIM